MVVYIFRSGTEYAGQTWWDERAGCYRWHGDDPLGIRPLLRGKHDFDAPMPEGVVEDGILVMLGYVSRPISSAADLGVCVNLATAAGADVEILADATSAPVDPASTREGMRMASAPKVPPDGLPARR